MSSAQPPLPRTVSPARNRNINQASLGGTGLVAGAASSHRRPPSVSYFPYPSQDMAIQDQTLSNTMANTYIASAIPADGRQPKFNEEWDASVRGGSIVDGPSATQSPYHQQQQPQQRQRSQSPNIQHTNTTSSRSEIITSDTASAHGISLSRGNTLKKKNSLRRSTSLKRSSSRRSMKAGSVRSLALQSSHEPDEIHSAFYCPVPTSGAPTEVLAQRFQCK